NCDSPRGNYTSALAGLYGELIALQYQQALQEALSAQYQAQQAQYARDQQEQARQQLLSTWASKGVYVGWFVKFDNALAIYRLGDDGLLHAFQDWSQFLRYGGHANLDNVGIFTIPSGGSVSPELRWRSGH